MRANTQPLIAASVVLSLIAMMACTSSTRAPSPNARVATSVQPAKNDDLETAMDKLEESIRKPSTPFHASFKKSGSDGFSYECEADISSNGIIGQQIDNNPATKIGTDVFPANTRTRQLKGTPYNIFSLHVETEVAVTDQRYASF
jgi:hypothetical protein